MWVLALLEIFTSTKCPSTLNMLVPLYVYPSPAWNTVINGASSITTMAVINPYDGPGGPPNADYTAGVNALNAAGITTIGYVCTNYTNRLLSTVMEDIDIYASSWPNFSGIFLDMVTAEAEYLGYYQTVHDYVLQKGYTHVIINPGTTPDSSYANVATLIVVLENYAEYVPHWDRGWLDCANKLNYAAVLHDAPNISSMESIVDTLRKEMK